MLDILQATPDLIAQAADSTEFISEPMRALLDSISAKTGQTALNTARDQVDWEVIQITRKEYYFAIATIILALVSLVVDIATTIFQHISSRNSQILTSKYSLEVQQVIAMDLMANFYHNSIMLMIIKRTLKIDNFKNYPSEDYFLGLQVTNTLDLEALCLKNTKHLISYNSIKSSINRYNSNILTTLEHLKSKDIPDTIKEEDLLYLTKQNCAYIRRVMFLMYELIPKKLRSEFYNSTMDYIFRPVKEEYDPSIHSTKDVPMEELKDSLKYLNQTFRDHIDEEHFYELSAQYYAYFNSVMRIKMIPIK